MTSPAEAHSARKHLPAILLLLVAGILFAWGIGSYALWDPWEPKYACAVQEMQERGDWITPYLHDKIRWTKPILIYWAMYLPTRILGHTEFAVRLPSVLAALFGLWVVYYSIGRLRGWRTGLIAAAVLMTLPQYFYLARQATPDMLMTAFLAAAMGFFALARFQRERRNLHLALFYAAVALAFLAKGPVACVIVIWAAILFYLPDLDPRRLISPRAVREDLGRLISTYRVGWGALIFLAIAGPWYATMLGVHGSAFVENFIFDENIHRFSDPLFGHSGTTTRYLRTLVHGTFPWGCLLPLSILYLFNGERSLDESQRQKWYFVAWAISVFSIFTIAGTKLDHYLLPIMPAVAVLIGFFWQSYLEDHSAFWVRPALLLSPLFLLMPVKDFVDQGNRYIFSVFVPAQDIFVLEDQIVIAIWGVFGSWTVVALAAGWARRSRTVPVLVFIVALASAGFFLGIVMPAHTEERSLKVYAETFDALDDPDAELLFYGWIRNSIYYYHGPDYRYFDPERLDDLVEYVDDKTHVYIVAQGRFFDELLDELHRASPSRWTLVSDDNPLFSLITNNPTSGPRRVTAD